MQSELTGVSTANAHHRYLFRNEFMIVLWKKTSWNVRQSRVHSTRTRNDVQGHYQHCGPVNRVRSDRDICDRDISTFCIFPQPDSLSESAGVTIGLGMLYRKRRTTDE
jgi:hypothetical protein